MTHDTITVPQQRGETCQIDNCMTGPPDLEGTPTPGPADIWIAIKGDLVYSDDDPRFHFNVWVCQTHYQEMATPPAPPADGEEEVPV